MQNSFFDVIMPFITHYENWYFIIGLFVMIIVWKDYKKGIEAILLTLIAFGISDFVNHNILKAMVGRTRPCNALPDVRILQGCTGSFSFPSSHASNIFAICTALAFQYKKSAILMLIIALSVSYSRVYLGVHYPTDVIAGGLFGFLYAAGVMKVQKNLKKNYLRTDSN